MDNPIKYSDLVQPDSSISNLITQLQTLIQEYDKAKTKIQGAAAQAAQAVGGLSSATEEQREKIRLVTEESEKLISHYRDLASKEWEATKELKTLNAAQKEAEKIDKLVTQIVNSQEGSYNRLSAQYRLNKIRLNEMSAAQRKTEGKKLEQETRAIYEEMSRLQKETGKYTLEVGHYENALRALPGPIGRITTSFRDMGKQLKAIHSSELPAGSKALKSFAIVGGTVIAGLALLFKTLKSGIQTIAGFEQANANLATILGKNVTQIEALTITAKNLGATTRYTASEVTALQTELAKLGFTEGQIIGMQKAVLNFATAVGVSLAEAAKLGGAALRIFGLNAEDADRALGVLAVATNKSAADASYFENALSTVGPVAKTFGLTIEDTAALLGTLANSGFDASSAATATRNILLNLSDANGKLAKNLGRSVTNFDEIVDSLIELRNRGVNLNDTLELTDKRSVAAFNSFLAGAEKAKALRNELQNVTGELDRIASERANTVQGSILALSSAWEGFTLAMSNSKGIIKGTIDAITDAVRGLTMAFFPEQALVSERLETFGRWLTEGFKTVGKEGIDDLISSMEKQLQDAVDQASKKVEGNTFLGITFGGDKELKAAQASLKAWGMAVKTFREQQAAATDSGTTGGTKTKGGLVDTDAEAKKKQQARVKALEAEKKLIDQQIALQKEGSRQKYELQLQSIEKERQITLAKNLTFEKELRQSEEAINEAYNAKREQAVQKQAEKEEEIKINTEIRAIQDRLEVVRQGSQEEIDLRLELLDKQRDSELLKNSQLAEELQQNTEDINQKYDAKILQLSDKLFYEREMKAFDAMQELGATEFAVQHKNEKKRTMFAIEQEIERWEKILALDEMYGQQLTDVEKNAIQDRIKLLGEELKNVDIAPSGHGLFMDLLFKGIESVSGEELTEEQKGLIEEVKNTTLDNISEMIDAYVQLADARYQAAQAATDAAQSALDAEIEARNNGYANQVDQARKELELKKQQEEAALAEKKKAQKAQIALDTATQISSLITAVPLIWKSLGGIYAVGPALAIAAIATMFGSFAAAKIKAVQLANTQEYGEGTVELLEGGSHASGNDIDMGTKKDGTRRRAEGGEFFAIINKRNSRKFRSVIPDVINSLNDGTFADKYQKASDGMNQVAINSLSLNADSPNLEQLQKDVRAIRNQGDDAMFVDGGTMVIRHKNLIRRVRK